MLVASKRNDIKKIVTVAGNLNHKLLHRHHNIPAMVGSLDPMKIVNKISHIKQIHYVGADDKIVPFKIANSFEEATKYKRNIKIIVMPNTTHSKGWNKISIN